MVVGVVNSALPFLLFTVAALVLNAGLSGIFNATAPLWGAVVAWLWLKDRPTRARAAGLAIGFAGVLFLAWDRASFKPGDHGVSPALGIAACVTATLLYGFSVNYTKKAPDRRATDGGGRRQPGLGHGVHAGAGTVALAVGGAGGQGLGRGGGAGAGLHRAGLPAVLPPDRPCRPGAGDQR
jgi:drug/metabolite transporter (DMT)-like permease